ncbi:MAG: nucleoid-associated protein [Emergencia timonensis]|uniref:nucleoid-associated protein n=1 Tax=Emergencia timonensis TaxID=1776384 RepID=UPI0008316AA5|nr:nucleoid-associated protein [Emergencia timonensis]
MIIKKAILHILDFNSDVCVFSQKELDITDYGTGEFIEKHLTKIVEDSAKKEGEFLEYSVFKQSLERYVSGGSDFTEFSTGAGTLLYDQISQADEPESMDFLVCQFTDENDEYIGLLLLPNKTAYTHQVESGDDGVANKIIRYFTLLPNTSQKISCYAIVSMKDYKVSLCDKKREINGEAVEVLPDKVLQCTFQPSARETVRMIKKITSEVADEYGANSAIAVSRAKNCIIENSEQNVPFTPSDLCEEVFYDNEVMKKTFKQKAMEVDIPAKISVENPKVVKSIRSHKIKTDTGIEIKIPTDYLENSKYVEFINNPDGTISIQLKNIGKIVNR